MPKDPTKNVDRYKIRGGTLNEFEFDENQEAYEEQKSKQGGGNMIPGTPPEKAKKAATKSRKATASKTASKSNKATKTVAKRGVSAKKLAAKKAAKKR